MLTTIRFFLISLFVLSCSKATGPYFQRLDVVEPGRGMIYFYRPNQIGSGYTYYIFSDGRLITPLDDQGYYPYIASPGPAVFSLSRTGTSRDVLLVVEAGQAYFVKLYMKELLNPFKSSAEPMLITVQNQDIAAQEIQACRLMQP